MLFGDFKRGYVIGDRGGSGINVKVLDQPLATQGQIVLLPIDVRMAACAGRKQSNSTQSALANQLRGGLGRSLRHNFCGESLTRTGTAFTERRYQK